MVGPFMLIHAITSWQNCFKDGSLNQVWDKPGLITIFQVLKARVYKLCYVYPTYKQGFADRRYLKRL